MPKSKSPNAANPAGSPAIKADEAEFKRNLTRYRNWLSAKSVHRAVRMVLPSYYDGKLTMYCCVENQPQIRLCVVATLVG